MRAESDIYGGYRPARCRSILITGAKSRARFVDYFEWGSGESRVKYLD